MKKNWDARSLKWWKKTETNCPHFKDTKAKTKKVGWVDRRRHRMLFWGVMTKFGRYKKPTIKIFSPNFR